MTLAIRGRAARLAATALVMAAVILVTRAGRSTAAWLEPEPATGVETRVEDPQVAIDGAGNTTIVWTSGETPNRGIRSAFRPAGGSWEPASTRMTSTFDCHDPRLAVNAAGTAALVAECEKPSASVRAAYRPGTSWNGQLEIPGSTEGNAPRVGIAPSGDADAVWAGPGSTVIAAHRPASGSWSSGAAISPAGTAVEPNLAVSPGGYAFALWREGASEVKNTRRSPGTSGTWTMPVKLNAAGSVPIGEPQIAIGVNGQRMMAWSQQGTKRTMAERTSSGDLFGINEPPVVLSESGDDVEAPHIAVDGTGLGVAAWRGNASGTFPLAAATTSTINGGWAGHTILSGPTTGFTEPALAISPSGSATVVWQFGGSVFAATRPPGGAFPSSSPVTISSPAQPGFVEAAVAMTSAGDAVSAWPAGANRVAVAVDDVTPPSVAVATPAPVEAGQPVVLTATAADTWSPVSLSWDFGDGATATGSSVSHAYASAGTKTATVTAIDGASNSSSRSVTVVVTVPGGGSGGGGSGGSAAGGGSPPGIPPDSSKTPPHRIEVTAAKVAQAWANQAKAKALQVKCKLDVKGTCTAIATVTKAVAKKLGLVAQKGSRSVRIGRGSVAATPDRFAAVKVMLTAKALSAIAASTQAVPVTFTLEGIRAGDNPGTASSRLTLHP